MTAAATSTETGQSTGGRRPRASVVVIGLALAFVVGRQTADAPDEPTSLPPYTSTFSNVDFAPTLGSPEFIVVLRAGQSYDDIDDILADVIDTSGVTGVEYVSAVAAGHHLSEGGAEDIDASRVTPVLRCDGDGRAQSLVTEMLRGDDRVVDVVEGTEPPPPAQ
jgi:hypothetical protein